ncbi:septum formation family protein [Clavibacter sp. km1a]|uniref:septum formation family protein n=1 Tax=Clavibacter sp. km1a TaxID=3459136 RepID=UPI0040420A64
MSGEAPGGGSGSGHDDDPFAVRPATDADRERPARPLAPIGWGRADDREVVPADREPAPGATPRDEGVDPAPAEPTPAPEGDILAGIVPLDPTEDADRVAPLDQADPAASPGDPDAADAPAPEPEIAAAPVDAGDVEFTGEPDPGYAPAPWADEPGEVLTGEVLTGEPEPVDDASAEMVLEPVDGADDDVRLADVTADGPVVDAELVEDPADEIVPETPAVDEVQLTPRVDDVDDEDAEVVDDHVAPTDAPQPAAEPVAALHPADEDAAAPSGADAEDDADLDDDEDDAPAPLAPAAAAARAAAMAWAAGSATAASASAAPAPAAPPRVAPAPAASDTHVAAVAADPDDAPAGSAHEPETAILPTPDPEPTRRIEPDADRTADHAHETPAADRHAAGATRPDADPTGSAPHPETADADRDEPVDALALLFGDVAPERDGDHADDADRTRVLPAASASAAGAAAAVAAPTAGGDAPAAAVPAASARPEPSSRPAPVPPPYAAPPAPRPPAPRAPVLDAPRSPAPPVPPASPPRGPRGSRRTGLWVGGAILLVLLLVGLFYLGQRLGSAAAPGADPVASPTAEATPTPSPTPTEPVQGPAAAGVQAWDALLGGECIDPYSTPWEEEFTVVDCGSEHHAQMVARVALPQTEDEFPGEDAVRDSADELCIADTVIDYAAARAYDDVQYQSAYPITQEEWTAGDRDAYCFVSRAGGGTFTGPIGVPQPPVVP